MKDSKNEASRLLEYAEKRLDDSIKNGTNYDVTYWRGYRDAARRLAEESR